MNLRSLFGRRTSALTPDKLPQLHSFVDVIVRGHPSAHVVVEAVDDRGVLLRGELGSAGEVATIVYTTSSGKYRAQSRVASIVGSNTLFERPSAIDLVGAATGAAQKRQTVRMDTLVQGAWRLAPGGKAVGDFARCSIGDISRGGCSVILDRELKAGTQIEVRLDLKSGISQVELLAEVMRHQVISQSGKHSHGVRFMGVRPSEDQAIVEFINRRQSDLRNRGLA